MTAIWIIGGIILVASIFVVLLVKDKDRFMRTLISTILVGFLTVIVLSLSSYYGRSAATYLTAGETERERIHTTIFQVNKDGYAYLYLGDEKPGKARLHKIEEWRLLDENGTIITQVPPKFKLIVGKTVSVEKTDKFHQYAKIQTVYYLFPQK